MGNADVLKIRLSAEGIQDVMNAFKKVEDAAKKTKASTDAVGNLRKEFQDLGVAIAIQQIASFVKGVIDAQAAIQDVVEVTGASAEAISVLGMAAKREGVSMEAMGKGIKAFAKFMGTVQDGAPEASKALAELGLSAKDLVGKSLDQQFVVLADAMNTFTDEGQSGLNKTTVAMKVFGKQGENMRQVLQQLSGDGFAKLNAEGLKTGQVLSGHAAAAAKEAKQELAKLEGQIEGVTNAFSQGLIPELVAVGESFSNATDGGQGFYKGVGSFAGGVLKVAVAALQTVVKTVTAVFAEILSHIEETSAEAGLYWDIIFGKGKIKDLGANIDRVQAKFAQFRKFQRQSAWEDLGEGLAKLFPDSNTSAASGSTATAAAKAKAEEEKKKKELKLLDEAAQKARAAARTAAVKREADQQKAQLDDFTTMTEDFYKNGLIDLDTYLKARQTAIEAGTAAEIAVLQAQIKQEIASRTRGMTPAERITSASKVADLEEQIVLRRKAGDESLFALERKGRDERKADALDAIKLEGDLEQAKGKTGEAAIKAIKAEYDERIRLAKTPEAKASLAGLKGNAVAKAQNDQAGKLGSLAQGGLAMDFTAIDQKREAGIITEAKAVELRTAAYEKWIPAIQEAAQMQLEAAQVVGDPALIQAAQKNLQELDGMKVKLANMKDGLKEFKDAARDAFIDGFANFLSTIMDQTASFGDKLKALGASIAQAIVKLAAMKIATAAAGAMGFMAEGGPVVGPGTATSDSVPIMASAGEFMVRAKAVQHYGLGTLAALNGLRLPKGSIRGFADGGPISPGPAAIPVRGDFSHSMQIGLDQGVLLKVLESPEATKILVKQTTQNARKFHTALGFRR